VSDHGGNNVVHAAGEEENEMITVSVSAYDIFIFIHSFIHTHKAAEKIQTHKKNST